jgi:hypothetical protein
MAWHWSFRTTLRGEQVRLRCRRRRRGPKVRQKARPRHGHVRLRARSQRPPCCSISTPHYVPKNSSPHRHLGGHSANGTGRSQREPIGSRHPHLAACPMATAIRQPASVTKAWQPWMGRFGQGARRRACATAVRTRPQQERAPPAWLTAMLPQNEEQPGAGDRSSDLPISWQNIRYSSRRVICRSSRLDDSSGELAAQPTRPGFWHPDRIVQPISPGTPRGCPGHGSSIPECHLGPTTNRGCLSTRQPPAS